ncbi:hypothetical protein BH24ACT22_BH24ACT22_17130 [soil metagenome]
MEHHYRRAVSFVYVGEAQAAPLPVGGFVGKVGQVLETLFGCAVDVHGVMVGSPGASVFLSGIFYVLVRGFWSVDHFVEGAAFFGY